MKKYALFFGALIAVIAVSITLSGQFGQFGTTPAGAKALSVNDVGADPAAYVGEITITGIMAAVSKRDATIFGIMDKKELNCTMENCNMVYIPVKYDGQRPAMGDEVLVTGSFTQSGGGYMFTAQDVQVVRNHALGG